MYDDLWALKLSYLNKFQWKSSSPEFDSMYLNGMGVTKLLYDKPN